MMKKIIEVWNFNATIEELIGVGSTMFAEALKRLPKEPEPIGKGEYVERQQRLFSTFNHNDLLLIPAPKESTHSNDVHYRYRTSSDLLYLTGWTEPESIFVARWDENISEWKSILFVQPKNTLMEIWEGRRPGTLRPRRHRRRHSHTH